MITVIFLTLYLLCVLYVVIGAIVVACLEPKDDKHPIVISNHVKAIGMEYPEGSFIRINLAWAGTVAEVKNIINSAGNHMIYLDYPTGRTKPPQPSMTLLEAQDIANEFAEHIAFFAFSNAWDAAKPDFIAAMRRKVDKRIKLVPKIETKGGVNHLEEIVRAADTDMVMLDAEDLYVNCNHSPKIFDRYKKKCRQRCKELDVMCIELKGVVFGYES